MSDWKKFVQQKYRDLKKVNPGAKLGDAMKKASQEWKAMGPMGPSKSRKMRKSRKARKSRKSRR